MKYILFALALLLPLSAQGGWEVPKHPDPDKIYDEAQEDTKAYRYELALEKHVWFHHNALKYERSLYGVRLSYALSDWLDLAKVYPPALVKLQEVRDQAAHNVKNGVNPYAFFHDFKSINEELGENEQTVNLFQWLDFNQPKIAKKVYRLAQPALQADKEYNLSGKYLDSAVEYKYLVKKFRIRKAFEKKENNPYLNGFADNFFTHHVSTLVALLVINKRHSEARLMAEQGKQELENEEFWMALKSALQGQLPAPWP